MHRSLLAACLAVLLVAPALAAEPVKLVVPFPPGGSLDGLGRLMADKLKDPLQASIIVENRPGANGNIGAMAVARAPADGNTLLMASDGVVTVNPVLYKTTGDTAAQGLTPIGLVAYVPSLLVVSANSNIRSLDDFVAAAKAKELTYSSGGVGSAGHLTMAYFGGVVDRKFMHVPYNGGAPAILAAVSGEVDAAFVALPNALPQVRGGKLRAIAVSSPQRLAQLPDTPTVAESGYPDFEVQTAYLLMAPAGLPAERAQAIASGLADVVGRDDVKQRIRDQGMEPTWLDAQATKAWLAKESERWKSVLEKHGISAES